MQLTSLEKSRRAWAMKSVAEVPSPMAIPSVPPPVHPSHPVRMIARLDDDQSDGEMCPKKNANEPSVDEEFLQRPSVGRARTHTSAAGYFQG